MFVVLGIAIVYTCSNSHRKSVGCLDASQHKHQKVQGLMSLKVELVTASWSVFLFQDAAFP